MISEIENKLLSINEDKFANLARLYLSYRFPFVYPTGSALGQEKSRTGTPDNFIPLGKRYFAYNEITTVTQNKLKAKLKRDIDSCFKQEDIPIGKIAKLILICNRVVGVKLYMDIEQHINKYSPATDLELIDIQIFANKIFVEYPSLCKVLGIPIDTGQILEINDFIIQHEKSKFAITIRNKFYNREKEVDDALEYLKNDDLLIISGKSGTGKTRFSIAIVERFFKENPDYNVKYIINNAGAPIWDDLKTQLIKDKNYIVVIDDANKLGYNLDFVVNFLKEERIGQIKIIFTVRDYVKSYIQERITNFKDIELCNFDNQELYNILGSDEFNISSYGIGRIFSLSKGNPRLAIMAATAIINENYDQINNAAELFEEYFATIKKDLVEYNNTELLKVAGILSLYRTIDTNFDEIIVEIEQTFLIDKDILFDNLKLLYNNEFADEYRGVYKIADQILGEYFFYLTFIDKKLISFQILLDYYLKTGRFSLIRVLNPIFENYGFEKIVSKTSSEMKTKWIELKNDKSGAIDFLKDFWFYIPTDGLIYLKSLIDSFLQVEDLKSLNFDTYLDNHVERYDDKIIDLLIKYRELPDSFLFSLDLLNRYGLTSQINFSKFLKALTNSLSYRYYDYEQKYKIQILLFDFLYEKAANNKIFYSKIIIHIANYFLVDSYITNSSDGKTLKRYHSIVVKIDEQIHFRKKLWEFIFECFNDENLKDDIYRFFEKFGYSHRGHSNIKIIQFDKELIIPFFKRNFAKKSFRECCIVDHYNSLLKYSKIGIDQELKSEFTNKEFELWLVLEDGFRNQKLLQEFTEGFKLDEYYSLLESLNIIYLNKSDYFRGYNTIMDGITQMLIQLANRDFELFLMVFIKIYDYEYAKTLLNGKLFSEIKYDNVSNVKKLKSFIYSDKNALVNILVLLRKLPENFILVKDYKTFKELLINRSEEFHFWFMDEIFKKIAHLKVDFKKELSEIIDILHNKLKANKFFNINDTFFTYLFTEHLDVFKKNIRKIEKIYLFLEKNLSEFDFNGIVLKEILSLDPNFILEVLSFYFDNEPLSRSQNFENSHLNKIWELNNAEIIISLCIDFLKDVPVYFMNSPCEASFLFSGKSEKEISFLKSAINTTTDEKVLRILYNIVSTKYKENKYEYLNLILEKNIEVEFFKKLDFYIQSSGIWGGRIPHIQKEIDEFKKLKDFLKGMNDINLLEHIQWVEDLIDCNKKQIEEELKREFLSELGY